MAKTLYRTEHLALGALLRECREEADLVQTALAERLGRNQTFVSNVELAIRRLDVIELRDYCQGLDIALGELIARWEALLPGARPRRVRSRKR